MSSGTVASFPRALRDLISVAQVVEVHNGMSGASVYRLGSTQDQRFLKVAPTTAGQELQAEAARLIWLNGKLPVPRVVYFADYDGSQYLMTTAVPGVALCDNFVRDRTPQVIDRYAQGARLIHSLPVAECPFDAGLDVRVQQARRAVESGTVDTELFDDERLGRSPESLYQELLESRPTGEDLVFTHGDYCAPNVLVDPATLRLTGFVDLGRAGVADRYQDLALAARSIAYNFGDEWSLRFFNEYGIDEPDETKVAFYKLLDEFF